MDSINDLIWKEEDENDIMQGLAIANSGVGMVQTCQVSMSSCRDDGGSTIDSWKTFYVGRGCYM